MYEVVLLHQRGQTPLLKDSYNVAQGYNPQSLSTHRTKSASNYHVYTLGLDGIEEMGGVHQVTRPRHSILLP
jgi:hypothetical protein